MCSDLVGGYTKNESGENNLLKYLFQVLYMI
jgi:hypothetical protein